MNRVNRQRNLLVLAQNNKPQRTVQKIFAKTALRAATVQNCLAKVANRFTAFILQRFCLR